MERHTKKYHSEQSEDDGRNSGKRLCRKLNQPHQSARFGIFIQIDCGAHADRCDDHQRQTYDIQGIYDISRNSHRSLQSARNGCQDLDDMTLEELKTALQVEIDIVKSSGQDLLDAMLF